MLKPIVYTYRGRPLCGGPSMPGPRKDPGGRIRLLVRILVLFAVISVLFGIASGLLARAQGSKAREDTSGTEKQTAVPEEAKGTEKADPESGGIVPARMRMSGEPEEEPLPMISPQMPVRAAAAPSPRKEEQTQEGRLFRAAQTAFREKRYEDVRKALRLFFEKLNVPPGHPLYAKAADMLSAASLKLYYSGEDRSNWKEYRVEKGDSLSLLARRFNTNIPAIREANKLKGNTLRIGQTLKIPQSTWRIRIERKNRRLLLDNNGRLFKIYPLAVGKSGEQLPGGFYRLQTKSQNPLHFVFAPGHGGAAHAAAAIHSPTTSDSTCFSMGKKDLEEFYQLVTEGTPAEIK